MLRQPLSNAFAPLLMPQLQSRGPVDCSVHAMGLLKAAQALSRAAAADTSLLMRQADSAGAAAHQQPSTVEQVGQEPHVNTPYRQNRDDVRNQQI
jgi:hypothetical protein